MTEQMLSFFLSLRGRKGEVGEAMVEWNRRARRDRNGN